MSDFSKLLKEHSALANRTAFSLDLIEKIKKEISSSESCAREDLCIFAVGSLARLETGRESDLDLFFIADTEESAQISYLEQIEIYADVIRINKHLGLPKFSGDGEYLKIHALSKIIDGTGTRSEDAENIFTTRLLLLLESRGLSSDRLYEHAIQEVISHYFRDDKVGRKDFKPLFLLNDILRYWRTLCLNYERTRNSPGKPWWKKNLNLKFPRKLAVFSNVLLILAQKIKNSDDFKLLATKTPLERLAYAFDAIGNKTLLSAFGTFLNDYEFFLAAKSHAELHIHTDEDLRVYSEKAQHFDDLLHDALASRSLDKSLVRYVTI